ncbi:pyruvate kinase [Nocardioides sp.]|uniref:pyruvate kinase n=1 Tax=Nocardioides sp. TaxID=35761 RepID=UPI0027345EC4|nr:pyruvate kinase [Nocardioides sp.]MDP3892720.1 pyruvate kinase [Nocardioides sp.]
MSEYRSVAEVRAALEDLRTRMVAAADCEPRIELVHPQNRASAENLVHYVALRRQDLRSLQFRLAELGLSSLGRSEAQVLAATEAVLRAAASLAGDSPEDRAPVDFGYGARRLNDNANALLGRAAGQRRTRIMVTLPTEAAWDPAIALAIVSAGAELVRVNCAHDDPETWVAMVRHVRLAEQKVGHPVKVTMDLAGPKLRTGPVAPGPGVLRLRPKRDELGRPVAPVRVHLSKDGGTARPGMASLQISDASWLDRRQPGDRVTLRDTRLSRRTLLVTCVDDEGVVAETSDTTYLTEGIEMAVGRDGPVSVGQLPPRERRIPLAVGDLLVLVPDLKPADPVARPARIGCTLASVFDPIKPGDPIIFDDGKIEGTVEATSSAEVQLRIKSAPPRGARLGADKGINLPETPLALPALGEEDVASLSTVVELADAVSLSFVRTAEDVAALQQHLADLGRPHLGVILKIETEMGFENLPEILLTAMRSPDVGVMIARGDLAVEAGYARMGEAQEEILWLCEAAHVPVVWATQVLDTLTRTGRPSRAEVTDAAMSGRAECVMLNKGPFVVDAITFLDDILNRMSDHQRKKRSLLRELHAWDHSVSSPA